MKMKIRINSNFNAFWGKKTPKVGDVLEVVSKNRRGYNVRLDATRTKYLIFYSEAEEVRES